MKVLDSIGLDDVRAVYSGAECDLWQLIMGRQIHIGGLKSSAELAARAGIQAGSRGIDLCCCKGAGMEFLVRLCGVSAMTGVDMTPRVVEEGRCRIAAAGLTERITFVQAEVTRTGLPSGGADFVWGEDAWCYVPDKAGLIREAVRLVRPGGTIAFTDWIEGRVPLTEEEACRFMTFMKFPAFADMDDYRQLLETHGCRIVTAEETSRFAPAIDLYLAMVDDQLAFDALAILGYDRQALERVAEEMTFAGGLARQGKLAQGLFVAVKA